MSPNDEWKGESGEDSVFYSGSFSCHRTCGLCQIYTTIWFLPIGLCYEICYSLQLYCQFILIDKCGKYLITRSWKMNQEYLWQGKGKGVGQLGKWVFLIILKLANDFVKTWSCYCIIL